jgi:MoaA/NifB/PqqE/SkfB family radical SAM enzyme
MAEEIRPADESSRDFAGKAFRSACYAPYVSLFFAVDGNVLACCQNELFVLRDVKEQHLREIWNGWPIQQLRAALEPCDFQHGCEYLRMGTEVTGR